MDHVSEDLQLHPGRQSDVEMIGLWLLRRDLGGQNPLRPSISQEGFGKCSIQLSLADEVLQVFCMLLEKLAFELAWVSCRHRHGTVALCQPRAQRLCGLRLPIIRKILQRYSCLVEIDIHNEPHSLHEHIKNSQETEEGLTFAGHLPETQRTANIWLANLERDPGGRVSHQAHLKQRGCVCTTPRVHAQVKAKAAAASGCHWHSGDKNLSRTTQNLQLWR
mmetsp:Transcript_2949/g.6673  ORF Transcript_2949/g.6673 Transcript_2949/m.6673 type:complete len:220 (-) Transcript_2949:11-670(-)